MTERRPPGEFELIDRIRALLAQEAGDLVIGPGDDCAAVEGAGGLLTLLTCDSLVEGRHFERRHTSPRDLGRKLAAINVSDVAAMGGRPRWGLLSLAVRPALSEAWTVEIAAGVTDRLRQCGAQLVGGNLSSVDGPIVVDLTLVGEVERARVVRRSGARPGDGIAVTGHLGSSAAGLAALRTGREGQRFRRLVDAHRTPEARLEAGRAIGASGAATAMIDLSDGLASDLAHVCVASGVAAEVHVDRLPVLPATAALAAEIGVPVVELALTGGEDYELLFTAAPGEAEKIARDVLAVAGVPVHVIGRVVRPSSDGPRVRFVDDEGRNVRVAGQGWDHFGA